MRFRAHALVTLACTALLAGATVASAEDSKAPTGAPAAVKAEAPKTEAAKPAATDAAITAIDAQTSFYGEEHLSPGEANGVLMAEVRRAKGVNNVFRRGVVTNEALDVGEDFIGASARDDGYTGAHSSRCRNLRTPRHRVGYRGSIHDVRCPERMRGSRIQVGHRACGGVPGFVQAGPSRISAGERTAGGA